MLYLELTTTAELGSMKLPRRLMGLLLQVFVVCLLLSLIVFLLTTPEPVRRATDNWNMLPWENGNREDQLQIKGHAGILRGHDVILDPAPPRRKRQLSHSDVQEGRQRVLEEVCPANRSLETLSGDQRRALAQRMVVNEDEGLLYCTVPFTGSGPWMKILYFLGPRGRGLANVGEVPVKEIGNRKNFVYLSSFSEEEQEKRLQSYTKLLVTRHPFSRLAISYKLKFEAKNTFFHDHYGKDIVKNYRHGPKGKAGASDGSDVKFSEFVEYVASVDEVEEMNEHWQPLASLCRPCELNYSFILHHETLDRDSTELLALTGLGERVPVFPHDSWDNVPAKYIQQLFQMVSPVWVGRLVGQYRMDLALFSYSSF